MATPKQEKATKVVISGGSPSQGMKVAEYAPSSIRKPKVLTESKGYKELLKKYGLTDELIATSLAEDIKSKKRKRVAELRLGAEILKMTDREKEPERPELHLHLHKNEELESLRLEYERKLREKYVKEYRENSLQKGK